jgi:hypothetical protein
VNNYGYLGIVEEGRFMPLTAEHPGVTASLRLTALSQESQDAPESEEISLFHLEGSAILVRGVSSGDWVYSATVVEQAGPILSAVVRQTFDVSEREEPYRISFRRG